MGKQRHVILKQTLEITVASDEEAWPLQQQASRIMRTKLKQLIERACDRLSSSDCLHRIDRLELDLGQLNPTNLAKELPAMFEEAFTKALNEAIAQPDPSGLPAKTASQWELFTQFFQQGTLPWWADLAKPHQPEESIDYLLLHAPDLIRQGLPALASDATSLQRMIHHLEDRQLAALVAAKAPALGDFPLTLFHALLQARSHSPQMANTPEARFANHRWLSILQHALLPEPPPADRADFTRGVLMRLACLQAVPYTVLVQGLTRASNSLQNPVKDVAVRLAQELASIYPPSADEWGNLPPFSKARPELVEWWGAGGIEFRNYRPGRKAPPLTPNTVELSTEILTPRLTPIGREGSKIAEEGIMLGNAGMVILWPFLGELFERLGLAHEKKIVDENARKRGVALLHYLATGDVSPPEYLLPLNKLLCGMGQDAVFELDAPLTDEETAECNDFLTSVIAQAPILHNMSIAGFRGSFLLRGGILSLKYGSWLLRVERETHDIVLDRFPWGFQWVILPWMEEPLRVEW